MGFARHLKHNDNAKKSNWYFYQNMIFVVNAANVIAIHVLNGDDIRINSYLHPTFCTNISMSIYVIKVIKMCIQKTMRGNASFLNGLNFIALQYGAFIFNMQFIYYLHIHTKNRKNRIQNRSKITKVAIFLTLLHIHDILL